MLGGSSYARSEKLLVREVTAILDELAVERNA
ncbi:unnamed protein product [Camellia sinensis]